MRFPLGLFGAEQICKQSSEEIFALGFDICIGSATVTAGAALYVPMMDFRIDAFSTDTGAPVIGGVISASI